MTTIPESIKLLVHEANEMHSQFAPGQPPASETSSVYPYDIEARFAPANPEIINHIQQFLPLSPELIEWYSKAAPKMVRIWWRTNFICLSNLEEELLKEQEGFRWGFDEPPQANVVEEGWDYNWVVIGHRDFDPFFVHTDRPGSPVSFCCHDDWEPIPIAPDLVTFFEILRVWIKVYYCQFGWEITDDNCSVIPEFCEVLRHALHGFLDESYIENIISIT